MQIIRYLYSEDATDKVERTLLSKVKDNTSKREDDD